MATWARIAADTAVEVIDFDPVGRFHPDVAALFSPVPDDVVQGSTWNGTDWTPPPEPEPYVPPTPGPGPVPAIISMRQAITQAAIDAWITAEEAEGWAMGSALPALVASVIAALPEPYRLPAKIKALRAIEVERGDPLMLAAATAALNGEGDVGETLDEFFRAAALL